MNPESEPQQRIDDGIAAWERHAYVEALDIFNRVIEHRPGFPDVHNRAGLCKAMLGNLQGALDSFERALELAPTYAEAHFNRGIVLNEMGLHEEAAVALRRAHDLDTRHGVLFPSQTGHQIADTHTRLGDLYRAVDRLNEAGAQYRIALEVRPGFADVRAKLAEVLLEEGDAEAARSELEAVLERQPDFADARLRLGVALQRLGDLDGAVRQWRMVLEKRPGDRRVIAYLASAGAPP